MRMITKDLFEAAYLLSQGMRVVKVFGSERTVLLCIAPPEYSSALSDKSQVFTTGDERLLACKQAYRQGEAEINVKALKRELKQVRDLVFNRKRELQNKKEILLFNR